MFGAILNLFQGNKQAKAEAARFELARQDALAAEQRQFEYNLKATAEQRAFDISRYDVERGHGLADYAMQRADAAADYQRMRGDALADVQNQFVNLRAAAEKGGFNPLAVLGMGAMPAAGGIASPSIAPVSGRSGVPLVPAAQAIGYVPPTDYMGSAVAEAGLALSDAFARAEHMATAGKLEANRDRLRRTKEAMQRDTIRPKVGGVYAQREQTRTKAEALGRTDGDRHGSPGWEGSGRYSRPNEGHPLVGALGSISRPDPTLDRGTGSYFGGRYLEAPQGWSNAEAVEQEFGEVASNLYTVPYLGAYAGHNAARLYDYASRADKRKPRMLRDVWKQKAQNRKTVQQGWQTLNGYHSGDSRR